MVERVQPVANLRRRHGARLRVRTLSDWASRYWTGRTTTTTGSRRQGRPTGRSDRRTQGKELVVDAVVGLRRRPLPRNGISTRNSFFTTIHTTSHDTKPMTRRPVLYAVRWSREVYRVVCHSILHFSAPVCATWAKSRNIEPPSNRDSVTIMKLISSPHLGRAALVLLALSGAV